MHEHNIQKDSSSWISFVKISFAISVLGMGLGIFMLPLDPWNKGFLAMGLWFTIGSSITLTKTLRDQHEADRLINRINHAQTEKIIKDMGS